MELTKGEVSHLFDSATRTVGTARTAETAGASGTAVMLTVGSDDRTLGSVGTSLSGMIWIEERTGYLAIVVRLLKPTEESGSHMDPMRMEHIEFRHFQVMVKTKLRFPLVLLGFDMLG